MAIVEKKVGKLPVYKGDWSATYNDGHGYMVKNRVTIFGSELESLIDNNTYVPATRDEQTGVVSFEEHWKVISNGSQAYAAALAATNKMAELEEEWDDQDQRMTQMQATINAKQLEVGAVQTDEVPTENSGNHMTSGDIYQTLKNSAKGFVDNEPTAGSENLVKSKGIQKELALGAVYDVSAKNPTAGPNSDGKWESLSALLSDNNLNTLIPTSVRKGGMSIKFVQSSDNKYVQYRLTSDTFNTTPANWQGVDDEPIAGSDNLVKSGGVAESISQLGQTIYGNAFKAGYYLNSNGEEVADANYAYSDYIPIVADTQYRIKTGEIINSSAKISVYRSDKTFLTSYTITSDEANYTFTYYGSSYIRISYNNNHGQTAWMKLQEMLLWEKKEDVIGYLSAETSKIEGEIVTPNIKEGYYLNSNGEEVQDANFGVSDYIPVTTGWYRWLPESTTHHNAKLVQYYSNGSVYSYVSDYNNPGSWFQITSTAVAYVRLSVGLGTKKGTLNTCDSDGNIIANVWKAEYTTKKEIWRNTELIHELSDEIEKDHLESGIVQKGYYFASDGSLVADENYGISDYIVRNDLASHTILFSGNIDGKTRLIAYNSNGEVLNSYQPGTKTGGYQYGTAKIRVSCPLGLTNTFVKDLTDDEVFWQRNSKADDYTQQVADVVKDILSIESYNMLSSEIISAIHSYRNKVCRGIKEKALTFGFLTDVHLTLSGGVEHLQRVYTMAKYAKASPAKFLLFGGDFVSGESSVLDDMTVMLNGKEAIEDNFGLDVFMVRGNHDGSHKNWKNIVDGGGHPTENDIVNNKDWYNMMVSSLDGIVKDAANPMGGYFYKDYEQEKVRLIVLNLYDMPGTNPDGNVYNAMYSKSSIRQNQATWLATKALDFTDKGTDKSNWGIIVTSHDGVDVDNSVYGDGDKIELLLQAFKKGEQYSFTYSYNNDPNYYVNVSADFRQQGPMNYLAYIHGHTHTDRVVFKDGVPHISSGADHPDLTEDMPSGATLPIPRNAGEVSEYLWDTAAVGNDMVSMFRFGAVEEGKTSGDRFIHIGANNVTVGNSITLTPTKVSGTLTWGIYSVSPGYYVPIVNGVAGDPVGTIVNHASINNGVVTGISAGEATAFAQDEAGNKEFFSIVVS